MEAKRRSVLAVALSSLLVLAFAAPAFAGNHSQTQDGLVNVAIGDVTAVLPIAIAANVCEVNVNVLARQDRTGEGATCIAVAESGATVPFNGGNGPNQTQRGLVNVAVGDITVLAPIGIAANICEVNANVLAEQIREDGSATCVAVAQSELNG